MALVQDSGNLVPQHWRQGQWQKTGDTNPLPTENYIFNGTTWVPVSATNPLPVSTTNNVNVQAVGNLPVTVQNASVNVAASSALPVSVQNASVTVSATSTLPIKGTSTVTDNPIPVTQAPKSSFQTMKSFTGTITISNVNISNPSSAPTLAASGSGNTLTSGTYYVKYTWVNAMGGESLPSPEASQAVTSGQQLTVTLPSFPTGVTSANIYISTTSGNETLQRNITSTSTSFTAPLSAGATLPSVSNINTYIQNLYTVTSGKTFYLTDFVVCNNTGTSQIQASINASQTAGASPVFIGHALNTAPLTSLNIGTEPSVAASTPITFQVIATGNAGTSTTVTYFVSGYEQ